MVLVTAARADTANKVFTVISAGTINTQSKKVINTVRIMGLRPQITPQTSVASHTHKVSFLLRKWPDARVPGQPVLSST